MECNVAPISNSSFDVQAQSNSDLKKYGYILKLKNPMDIFYLNQKIQYVGQVIN